MRRLDGFVGNVLVRKKTSSRIGDKRDIEFSVHIVVGNNCIKSEWKRRNGEYAMHAMLIVHCIYRHDTQLIRKIAMLVISKMPCHAPSSWREMSNANASKNAPSKI